METAVPYLVPKDATSEAAKVMQLQTADLVSVPTPIANVMRITKERISGFGRS